MTRHLMYTLLLALCVACTPGPRSPDDPASSSDGVTVYGVIDTGFVINR